MNQAEREQCEQMVADNADQDAYKRRSSILKPKDETTKLLPNTGIKRRVSFHKLRKIQEFDKEKCDLLTDHQQEEPMHLTNNSDGLKPENTFSVSFVAGSNQPQDLTMANNATMTFLHSLPQAISTPVRTQSSSNSDTTTVLFQKIAAAAPRISPPPTFIPLQPIKSGRGGDDFTSLFFANVQAPGRTEREPPMAMEQGEDLTCAVFANIACKTGQGAMNMTSSVFASLGINTGPTKGVINAEPMDLTSELFEVVQKGASRPSPVLRKPSPVIKKPSPVVNKFSNNQPAKKFSPVPNKPATPPKMYSSIVKPPIKQPSPVVEVSKPVVKDPPPIAAVVSKAPVKSFSPAKTVKAPLKASPSPVPKAAPARAPKLPSTPLRVTPARKVKTPNTPLQTTPRGHRQTFVRTNMEVPPAAQYQPPPVAPRAVLAQKEPSPVGKSPSFNFTTTINSPASFMEGHNAVDSLPFKHLTTIEEKSAPNFTFESFNDSVQPLEEGDGKMEEEEEEDGVVEEEKQEKIEQLEMEHAEEEKMELSENSRWSMAFHGDSPSGVCNTSVQAAEKRKQLLDLMTSTRRDRSYSSSPLSQSYKSPSAQCAPNAWPSGNESQIELLEDIGCPNQADLLQLSENTKTYPLKEAYQEGPVCSEQDTYTIEPKSDTPAKCSFPNNNIFNKHQPPVPSPMVMSEITYVLHQERSYNFNSAAKKTPQHKIFGESLMLSPWAGGVATPGAHKQTFCDYTMNTKALGTVFQEPTYIDEGLDDGLEEDRQRFLQEAEMVKKVSEKKRALYAMMRELLQRRANMQKAEKHLETEMRTSFQTLLTKRSCN